GDGQEGDRQGGPRRGDRSGRTAPRDRSRWTPPGTWPRAGTALRCDRDEGDFHPMPPTPISTLGFIGLGVMGEPMCGHLARRAGKPILAHDLRPEPLERLASNAVTSASLARIAADA